jgi:outer membrane protein assembly factor BamA
MPTVKRFIRPLLFVFTSLFLWLLAAPAYGIGEIPDTKTLDDPEAFERSDRSDNDGPSDMGQDIRKFGEGVAQRIDRIVKKKSFELAGDPWTMQGIPFAFPSPDSGFNLGLRLQMQNIRRQDPHQMEIIAQVLSSDRGRQKHMLQLDLPWAFGNLMRLTARIAYDRDVTLRYYGIGNANAAEQELIRSDSPLYQNVRAGPTINLQLFRYWARYLRGGPIFNLRWTDVTYPSGSLMEQELPVGVAGGRTHSIGLALIYDTLDFEPYPSRGDYHELFFNLYSKTFTGSSYDFTRTTYTFRKFIPLHRRLIFAHRTLIEYLSGDVPFFELGAVGGSYSAAALGGDRFLRGYEGNQFMDKLRLVLGFELRWDPLFLNFLKQDLTIGFVPFFDVGRVWPDGLPTQFDNWHASAGWGMRFIWNSRLVVRLDSVFTSEGFRLVGNLGSSF